MPFPLIISCLFGSSEFDLYSAPIPDRKTCIFFTNRPDIAALAKQRGWQAILMPYPIYDDPIRSSLQSKSIKFLSFCDDPVHSILRMRAKESGVLYFDHKFRVEREHINSILERSKGSDILIRTTPKDKPSIWHEVEAAKPQERYSRHMPQTLVYIQSLLDQGYSENTRICNTGLIFYSNVERAFELTRAVYNSCMFTGQPECQIFWALHAQKFEGTLLTIDWLDSSVSEILWKDPLRKKKDPLNKLSSRWRRIRRKNF